MSQTQAPPVGKIVGPGDVILKVPEQGELRLGAGLAAHEGFIKSSKAGLLKQTRTGQLWLEGRQKRYIPAENDLVVGTIIDRHYENFTVDIGAPFPALLPQLSFEGATRRNRPNLHVGDVVYARVVSASRDQEPILSCTDAAGRAAGFGQLKDGVVINCSTALARRLLSSPPAPVLAVLGASLQYEIAVGLNGRAWIASPSSATTILVSNAILKSEFLTETQIKTYIARMVTGTS